MVRTPCCKEEGIKKGAWTPEEDQKLIAYLQLHGEGGWRTLPQKAGNFLYLSIWWFINYDMKLYIYIIINL